MRSGTYERYYEIRKPCPGCEIVGDRTRHELCCRQRRSDGYIVQCRSLGSNPSAAPSSWRHLGDAPYGCQAFFVPDGFSASRLRSRPRPRIPDPPSRPRSRVSPDEERERLEWRRKYATEFHRGKREAAERFYAERKVSFDQRLYSAGPSRKEAQELASWLGKRGEPSPFWGFNASDGRSSFRTDQSGEVWEWALDIDGAPVGYSRRLLQPRKGRSKALIPKGGGHRLHHSLGCRDAVLATETLVVTEGIRKANETARRTGYAALGLPGVSISGGVAESLRQTIKELKPKRILLAPDFADMADGEHRHDPTRREVVKWPLAVEAAIAEAGLEGEAQIQALAWDPTMGKGVDDVLAALGYEGDGLPGELESLAWGDYLRRWRWGAEPRLEHVGDAQQSVGTGSPELVLGDDAGSEDSGPPPSPPAPEATRPLVYSAEEAFAVSAEVVDGWTPGEQSLAFCGWPGIGKTTAAGENALRKLSTGAKGWTSCVAVLSLPRRADVQEKAEALRSSSRSLDLQVDILQLLGRSPAPESGWYCEAGENDGDRVKLQVELQRRTCIGCSLREQCGHEEGRFLFERRAVMQRIKAARKESRPLLLTTTHASLPWLIGELPKRAPILIDDAGATFALIRKVEVRREDLLDAAIHARDFAGGRDLDQELDQWRSWSAAEGDRAAARDELKAQLKTAQDVSGAATAAANWASRVGRGLNQVHVYQSVETHWRPDKPLQVLRRLDPLLRARDRFPDGLTADLVARVLDALAKPHARKGSKRDRVRETVETMPLEYRQALESRQVRPPMDADGYASWPWEAIRESDGHDLRPSFTRMVLDAALEVLVTGSGPIVHRVWRGKRSQGIPEHSIHMAVRGLIDRARAGHVLWTSVGPMPEQALESLDVRQEVVLAHPPKLRTVVCQVGGQQPHCFGPGDRRGGMPSLEDEITRTFFLNLAQASMERDVKLNGHSIRRLGGVLHKVDRQAIEAVDREAILSPDREPVMGLVKLRHYGDGHAASDDLADRDTLVVRRLVPSFDTMLLTAETLRRALAMKGEPIQLVADPKDGPSARTVEARTWLGVPFCTAIFTSALEPPLAREVQRFYETTLQLNAVGRCRPISADGTRLVLLLTGRPFDWIHVETRDLFGVAEELGIELPPPPEDARLRAIDDHNERQAQRALDRQGKLEALLQARPDASQRQLASDLGITERTLRRDLAALREAGERLEAPLEWLWGRLEGLLARSASGHPLHIDTSMRRVSGSGTAIGGSEGPCRLAAVVQGTELIGQPVPKTSAHRILKGVRAALSDGSGPPPATRSTQRRNLQAVLVALLCLLENEEGGDGVGGMAG